MRSLRNSCYEDKKLRLGSFGDRDMIGTVEEMHGYVSQFDDELGENDLPYFEGLLIGSGSLAYRIKEETGEEPFPITDLDIYTTDEEFVDALAETPYGTRFEDRRFKGGAYRLGEDREELPETISSWDVHQGVLSEGPVVDIMTRMDDVGLEWQLRATLENSRGSKLEADNMDLRVISLSTFIDTKENSDREKDRYHKKLVDELLETSYGYTEEDMRDLDMEDLDLGIDYELNRRTQFVDEF